MINAVCLCTGSLLATVIRGATADVWNFDAPIAFAFMLAVLYVTGDLQ